MAVEPAAMVLDMLADTIDALNKGQSGDATVIGHLQRALDASAAVSVYVDVAGVEELVASAPDAATAQPLLATVSMLDRATLSRHVTMREVSGVGHVVIVVISPPEDGPAEGFARILAFARDEPWDEPSKQIMVRACRPVAVLWPRAAQALALQRTNEVELGITDRELQVLELLAKGLLATSIASRLNLSPRTVHKHLGNIYRKLGVHDRLVAVGVARAHGLLPEPGASARPPSPTRFGA